jgi:hypothetical protein
MSAQPDPDAPLYDAPLRDVIDVLKSEGYSDAAQFVHAYYTPSDELARIDVGPKRYVNVEVTVTTEPRGVASIPTVSGQRLEKLHYAVTEQVREAWDKYHRDDWMPEEAT